MDQTTRNHDKSKVKNSSEDSIPSFIRKTYEILEEDKYSDVIKWSDEGTAIIIVNPTEFAQKVLPVYFKHNNLTSFIRQLNMYDFHKKRSLNMDHVYCHDLFQRGKKYLLKEIRRKNSEAITPSIDKSIQSGETTQTKHDLAAVVHENVLLKNINQETLNRINVLESKMKEVSLENQTLWSQIYQLREKESILKNVIINYIRQNNLPITSLPATLQNEFDMNTLSFKGTKENSPTFLAQTTTKMHLPSGTFGFPQNYSMSQPDLQGNMLMNNLNVLPQSDNPFMLGSGNSQLYLDNFSNPQPYLDTWSLGLNMKPVLSESSKINKSMYDEPLSIKKLKSNSYGLEDSAGKMKGHSENMLQMNANAGKTQAYKHEGLQSKVPGEIPVSYR